jgi:hypothetical protein
MKQNSDIGKFEKNNLLRPNQNLNNILWYIRGTNLSVKLQIDGCMQTFTLYKFDKLNFFILSARHLNNIRE